IQLLRTDAEVLVAAALRGGVPSTVARLFPDLFIERPAGDRGQPTKNDYSEEYGFIEEHYSPPPEALDFRAWDQPVWNDLRQTNGILRLAYLIFAVARSMTPDDLLNLGVA